MRWCRIVKDATERATAALAFFALALTLAIPIKAADPRIATNGSSTVAFFQTTAADSYSTIWSYATRDVSNTQSTCKAAIKIPTQYCTETLCGYAVQEPVPCLRLAETMSGHEETAADAEEQLGPTAYDIYLRPLPTLGIDRDHDFGAAWVPASEARSGPDTVAEYEDEASASKPFDCGMPLYALPVTLQKRDQDPTPLEEDDSALRPAPDRCLIVYRSPLGDDGHILTLCAVLVQPNEALLPGDCKNVAIILGTNTWVRVATGFFFSFGGASPRYASEFATQFREILNSPKQARAEDLLEGLNAVLTSGPFSFTTRLVPQGFEGVVLDQPSEIIKSYRVRADIFLFVTQPTATSATVEFTLTLFVNKQNTSEAADWHGVDDDQFSEYFTALSAGIAGPIERFCKGKWLSSTSYECVSN